MNDMEIVTRAIVTAKYPIPLDYHVQNGCFCCANVFVMKEYEWPDEYYCHIDKSVRPKCGSVLMNEDHQKKEESDVWEIWGKAHKVACAGMCSGFEKRK